ncbi:BatE protein [Flavobacterium suaedae]|uniref:BatE protein n=1 Tax=Flavobacterium suaedae TaxID=1767027 RepID=A0ABQ1K098_9FLAO|nr:tetratricopeptide repeat protein [Flavobacterium suaedae]GGB83683.1 BatE protein [Flavobacterium suaedae]
MKKLLYIVTVVLLSQVTWGQQAFKEANKLYQEGKYAQAAKGYEDILKGGEESAELYFNLGNAYYKMDEVAPAIYNYEKSLLLKPNDKDTKINLGYAQKMTIDHIEAVPQVGFSKILYNFTGAYHYNTWAWAAIAGAVLVLLFFVGYYFAGTTLLKRVFFGGMVVALLGIVVCVLSAMFVKSEGEKLRPAIVFSEVVSVKSEPNDNAPDAFILHEGTKVFVQETLGNYKKIELEDDSEGWIERDAIKELK